MVVEQQKLVDPVTGGFGRLPKLDRQHEAIIGLDIVGVDDRLLIDHERPFALAVEHAHLLQFQERAEIAHQRPHA